MKKLVLFILLSLLVVPSYAGWQEQRTNNVTQFVPDDFVIVGDNAQEGSTYIAQITTSSTPNLDKQNRLPCLVWSDGETCYAQVSFKVPQNYYSGGGFRVFTDYNTGSDNPLIHYKVFVNEDGQAWDSSATTQSDVDPSGTAGTPELVSLPVTTDFSGIEADDVITFMMTRSDGDASTADLEVYYVEFYWND